MTNPSRRYFVAIPVIAVGAICCLFVYYSVQSSTPSPSAFRDSVVASRKRSRGTNHKTQSGKPLEHVESEKAKCKSGSKEFDEIIILMLSEIHEESNLGYPARDLDSTTASVSIPTNVVTILQSLRLHDLLLILLSPNFLISTNEHKDFIVFGAFQDDKTDRTWDRMKLSDPKFEITVKFHHVIIKSGTFHLIINKLYRREHFYFVEAVSTSCYKSPTRAFFRFDTICKSNIKNDSLTICQPRNLDSYIWHYEFSEFRSCNTRMVESFKSNHINYIKENKRIVTDERFYGMLEFRNIFFAKKMPIMLWAGSLLGWYRHCDTIPHSHDADFALLEHLYDATVIQDIACSKNFSFKFILGKRVDSLEMTVYCKGSFPMDVFLLYPNDGLLYNTVLEFGSRRRYRCMYPKIAKICSTELRGHIFYVPCNFEDTLQMEYGYNWMSAVKSYSYISDPKNTILHATFNKKDFNALETHPKCEPRPRTVSSIVATTSSGTPSHSIIGNQSGTSVTLEEPTGATTGDATQTQI